MDWTDMQDYLEDTYGESYDDLSDEELKMLHAVLFDDIDEGN